MEPNVQPKESLQLADGNQSILTIKELLTDKLKTIDRSKCFANKTEALLFVKYLRREGYTLKKSMKLAVNFAKEYVSDEIAEYMLALDCQTYVGYTLF